MKFIYYLNEQETKISSGLVLTDGNVILGCKVRYGKGYDIPKGIIDKGESPQQACIRETKEETGILVDKRELQSYGRFKSLKGEFAKDLYIFKWMPKILPDINKMYCSSYFYDDNGQRLPEVQGYSYISINEINRKFSNALVRILEKII